MVDLWTTVRPIVLSMPAKEFVHFLCWHFQGPIKKSKLRMKKRCFYVISYMAYYVSYCLVTKSDSFATLKRRSVGCQALLSTGFPRQVYWSGLPFSSPRDLPYWEVSQVVESVAEWLCGKESAYQCRRLGFNPWIRKIPWRKKWQPIPVFLPRTPRTVELGRLQSRGSQRVGHDLARTHTCKLYF